MRKRSPLWLILLPLLLGPPFDVAHATDRILLAARINDQPVELVFDSGAEYSVLFRGAAKRLGLRVTKVEYKLPLAPGRVPLDVTEECAVTFRTSSVRGRFGVIDDPPNPPADSDGIMAWSSFSNCVIRVNVNQYAFEFLDGLPSDIRSWSKWKQVPNSPFLLFECPSGKESARVGIDTGSCEGVGLNPKRWQEWRAKHERQQATIDAYWTPAVGVVVNEMMRAKKITIGGLTLKDVPVTVNDPSADILFGHADAILGAFVFRQLEVILDGRKGVLYTRPVIPSSRQYDYNRLGAVFVPKAPDKDDDLVANVVVGSPAYRAGIRNGDVLLRVGEIDASKWRTDPHMRGSQFWSQPAGTTHKLTLRRGEIQFETTVTLEDVPAVD